MEKRKRLPVGIENFSDIRKLDFYYIDKTNLIKEILFNWAVAELPLPPFPYEKDFFGKKLNEEKSNGRTRKRT